MKCKVISLIILTGLILTIGCGKQRPVNYEIPNAIEPGKVIYAGVRSSNYGIKPFPDPVGWQMAMAKMTDYYQDATPCAIWIVGRLKSPRGCRLEFPADSKQYTNVFFNDNDKHEPYLSHFDSTGIKVFLQVEPGDAGGAPQN
jgi:hypothetical protein